MLSLGLAQLNSVFGEIHLIESEVNKAYDKLVDCLFLCSFRSAKAKLRMVSLVRSLEIRLKVADFAQISLNFQYIHAQLSSRL